MQFFKDKKFGFSEMFNEKTGLYIRTDDMSGKDPFMRSFPALLDIGIMGVCKTSAGCTAGCYQSYYDGRCGDHNMSLQDYKTIIDQCKGKVFQVALGGRGNPQDHEDFAEILKYTRENYIAPNFTSSCLSMSLYIPETIALIKEYCGAVAISDYLGANDREAFKDSVRRLTSQGIAVTVHLVLDYTEDNLRDFPLRIASYVDSGVSAVVLLTKKHIGENAFWSSADFITTAAIISQAINGWGEVLKFGFDSCATPALVGTIMNNLKISHESVEPCEGARFSAYIHRDMRMSPCSFDTKQLYSEKITPDRTIQDIWNGERFENFRRNLQSACPDCSKRDLCLGGCQLHAIPDMCKRRED
jgi:radical SAM protein with 4Fe4S-binding SPASM domain